MNILSENIFSTQSDGSKGTRGAFIQSSQDKKTLSSNDYMNYGYDYFDNAHHPFGYSGYNYDGRYINAANKIIDLFNLKKRSKIYEIGCAKGYLLAELFFKGYDVCGLDYSEYAVSKSHPQIKKFICQGDAAFDYNQLAKESDLVICKETLPHLKLENALKAVKLMGDIVKNKANILLQIQYASSEEEKDSIVKFDPTHQSILTLSEWEENLKMIDFKGSVHFKKLF